MAMRRRVPLPGTRLFPGHATSMLAALLALTAARPAAAQQAGAETPRSLSLAQALHLAEKDGEQVRIARADVQRAQADQRLAVAARLPQLNGSLGYTRTLDSQFRGVFADTGSSSFGGANFSSLGFGSLNTYNLGLSLSWRLFDGGALAARSRSADAGHTGAQIALTSAHAQLVLNVTTAYYDAQLAQRMVDIAQAALAQAEATLKETTDEEQQGTQSEFEVLRARVDRDNRRPEIIQRQTARDVAFFRLEQLLDLPLDRPLTLTDDLEQLAPGDTAAVRAPAPGEAERAPVRQAEAGIDAVQGQVDQARAERFPGVSVTSAYGRVAYPQGVTPAWGQFRTNWTVGVSLDLPIFQGGRIGGDELTAQAGLAEARARLDLVRKQAALDTYQARAQLESARASWAASTGTVEEAQRAYEIAEIRFREGLSSQLELSDARLLLEQARGNRAQAARDLHVAAARVRLLPDLPLAGAGATGGSATAVSTSGSGTTQAQAGPATSTPGATAAGTAPGGTGR